MNNITYHVEKWMGCDQYGTPQRKWRRIGNFRTVKDANEFIEKLKLNLNEASIVVEVHNA